MNAGLRRRRLRHVSPAYFDSAAEAAVAVVSGARAVGQP